MTNEKADNALPEPIEPSVTSAPSGSNSGVRFAMVALYVKDLQRSVDFYRLVGLDISDPHPNRPVVSYREGNERRMIIATDAVAKSFDPDRNESEGTGYQQAVEFFVTSDAAVDAAWERLTGAGYTGVAAPARPNGAYATLIRDPDANVVLITHEPGTN